MRKILFGFVLLLLFSQCKTAEKPKENLSDPVTINQVKDDTTNKPAGWPASYYEGWVDSTTVQAFYSTSSGSVTEEDRHQIRVRLAWLMLIESYNLSRGDMSVAERLSESRLFQEIGEETILERNEKGKWMLYIKKTDPALRSKWNSALLTMEEKLPRLRTLRK